MQILPFILTQLPQFVLNLTNPSSTSTSTSTSTSMSSTSTPLADTAMPPPTAHTGHYTLPPLPYAYDALEPYISSTIMTLHHTKHHQAYVTNLNAALSQHPPTLSARIALQSAIRFNGGGHINHSLFWRTLAPAGSPAADPDAAPTLVAAIAARYGGVPAFREAFAKLLMGIQGSGWGWLVVADADGRLEIETTRDQDPVAGGRRVVLGVDMWEHAYYIQYYNNKAAYVEGIWNIINWEECEKRFLGKAELSL